MLSKLKNIAKRWEGCSKSHFSHIRNKVKSIFNQIFYRFGLYFKLHGPPQNCIFFIKFWSWCRSRAILAPRECPKCSKTAPGVDFSGIWYHFGVDFGRNFKDFQTRFQYNFHANVAFDAYLFSSIKAARFQLAAPIFSFFARWRLFARSALDIYTHKT